MRNQVGDDWLNVCLVICIETYHSKFQL